MEIEAWIKKSKELYNSLLIFLESENDSEDEFQALTKIIDDQEIVKNEQSIKEMFQLLYKIGDNHHRSSDFFNRLVRVIKYLKKEQLPINDKEILDIYKSNKRLLLLLFEHKIITPNESLLKYLWKNSEDTKLKYYLYSEIKNFIDEKMKKSIENKFTRINEDIELFERKCKEGVNDSLICKLIRQDSIQEFVSYVNRTNLSLTSCIKADFYESNTFLILNESSLIEYAFFYGSIQIIKYLLNNHVTFPPRIWEYAIHSNNPEMIEFLEDNDIEIDNEEIIVVESIKCHHNDIANYIITNLVEQSQYYYIDKSIIEFKNYFFLPDDIISIISNPEKSKFRMCYLASSFSNITIPSSIASIGNGAFSGCLSLTQISIPSSVTSIGDTAFSECLSLTQISIPSSVTSIGNKAFSYCSRLTQISIPSSVTSIGNKAFSYCSRLKQISIPSSVASIGNNIFLGIKKLTITGNIKHIPDNLFNLEIKEVTFPSSVISIGNNAFEDSALKRITFESPSSLISIGKNAFSNCKQLTEISIPSSVITNLNDGAFNKCKKLKKISFSSTSSLELIGFGCFSECESLTDFSFLSKKALIDILSFNRCQSLIEITIPSSMHSIPKAAFSECFNLKKVNIPSSITSIKSFAFYECHSLNHLEIPPSVTLIEQFAFGDCFMLEDIKIHDDIIFQLNIDKSAFSGCPVLEKLYLEFRDIFHDDDDDDDITNHEEIKLLSFDLKIIGKSYFDNELEIDEALFN